MNSPNVIEAFHELDAKPLDEVASYLIASLALVALRMDVEPSRVCSSLAGSFDDWPRMRQDFVVAQIEKLVDE